MTMPSAESSLHIGFDVTRTKAVLRADEQCRADLTRIAARFPGVACAAVSPWSWNSMTS